MICPTISLAPISRIEKYQETAKEELAIALDIYNTKIRWLDNDFDNALFQTIANDAIQQVIKRSRLRVVENLRFISTCLKEKAKIHNWHFEAPINLLKIDIESQPFDYRQFKDWHQVNDIKLKLKQHLTNKNFASSSYSELLTLFFISVMLHTHLTSKNRLEKLLEALINEHYYFYEGRIYFELATRENQIQRIAIDLTSALLFNRLLESSAKELSFKQLLLRIRNFLKKEFDIDPSTFQSGIELDAHLFIPSALVAVQTGDRKIASISKASLLRINSKQRLIENAPETTENKFDKEVINLSSGITPLSSKFNLETQLKSIRLFSQPLLSNNKILRKDLKAKLKLAFDSEIKPNEDLADITKVLCIWLISRIDAPGLRKSELAFKTINNYFKLFASLLMEHIQDKKIQSFSSDELIDIYNQILISQPPEYQANTAHQLFSFHQKVCCELYRLDEIEMDDLSFESDESDPRIKATLVMPWEVEKASLTLDKSIDTSHLKIQSQAILSLYSRLGFRPSELMDIDPKDVKSQYISIRWNRLGGLKRPQSFRSAFFNEKFGEPEHKNLNACVKLHASSKAIKFKRFWITNFQTSEQEKHLFLNTINGVLKNVTGDSQVNIYSLRHSIATIEIMNYFANILDFEGIEHELRERFQLEHYYPKGFSSFMKKCFSHTLPSRRHLYRTGRSLGHQTAKTSLTNYSHFYEFVMPFYFVEEFGSEFNKMLVNLSGKTDDAIKSLRKREKNPLRLSEQLVAQIARKQEHIINLKNVEKHYLTQRQPALFRIKNQSFALSPTLLYQALIFLTENPTPDSQMLINRYMINDEQLTLIKGKYHEMYLLTGFDPFCFKADLENDTSALEDQERVFKLKDSFGLLDKSLNPEMLDLWSRYHDPQRPFWHFETKEQLKEFTTLLQQAGVPNDHIFIGTDLKQQNGLHSEIDGILYRYCKFATAKPIPRMQSPSLLTDQPGVVLSASVDKKAPFLNKQLNLIFFVKILFSKIFE